MEPTLSLDMHLAEELSSSEPARQLSALSKVTGAAASSHLLPAVLQYAIVGSSDAAVRKAAYGTLGLFKVFPMSQWSAVSNAVASDLCSFDPDLRIAALGALQSMPLAFLAEREREAPGQTWIGGGKDESQEVHCAALATIAKLAFRERFCQLGSILFDSWDFVCDCLLDANHQTQGAAAATSAMATVPTSASAVSLPKQDSSPSRGVAAGAGGGRTGQTFFQACSLVAQLFAYSSGFEKVPPDTMGSDHETEDMRAVLGPVADHVASGLAPHLQLLMETCDSQLKDSHKWQCLYAFTYLAARCLEYDDAALISELKPAGFKPLQQTDSRDRVMKMVSKYYLTWLESTDSFLAHQTARNLLHLAEVVSVEGVEWLDLALPVLANLLRRDAHQLNRDVVATISLAVPRLPRSRVAPLISLCVQAVSGLPDRAVRLSLLLDLFTTSLEQRQRPLEDPSVVRGVFGDRTITFLWKDSRRQAYVEEVLLCFISALGQSPEKRLLHAVVALLESTSGCLLWSTAQRSLAVGEYLRVLHSVLTHLGSLEKPPAEESTLRTLLTDRVLLQTLRKEALERMLTQQGPSLVAAVSLALLVTHLAEPALESEFLFLLNAIKVSLLRMDELEKYAATLTQLRALGKFGAPEDWVPQRQPRKQPQVGSIAAHCLDVLCTRLSSPVVRQQIYSAANNFQQYCGDNRPLWQRMESVKQRVQMLLSQPAATPVPLPRFRFLSLLDSADPQFCREDDSLWVALERAALARQQETTTRSSWAIFPVGEELPSVKKPTHNVVSGQSDPYCISVAHRLNPVKRRLTLFVRLQNVTASPLAGGVLAVVLPEHMRPCLRVNSPNTVLSESILKTNPGGTTELKFVAYITRFAPVQIMCRVSIAVPSPQDPESSSSSCEVVHLYTSPYSLSLLELLLPPPIDRCAVAQFESLWARLPAYQVDEYTVEADVAEIQKVFTAGPPSLPLSVVFCRQYSADSCLQAALCSITLFDEILALSVTAHRIPAPIQRHRHRSGSANTDNSTLSSLRLHWKCSSSPSLSSFSRCIPSLVSLLLHNRATHT